ncbi:RNA polymerase sigma factor [Arthrobacter sp. Y81]|uniref:RNA polymerase sigma factor n=1 Tax=Arthrobacter sp. Y81 TaxID=2058897 RepID=UPI000CE3BCAA|nr:sigma-70 family RNA polymerase sigma factor [Arthrobacter sp. Y81]
MLSERELAFIALHKDNYPRVYSYIRRRIDDPELAQELAADVFRVVWQKPQATGSEIAWLLTIARNLVGNAYRARDRQQALQEKLRIATTTTFEGSDENATVHDAMAALREKDRDILQLAYWDGLTMAEIAGVLRCTESAAKVRLHRARAAFRKHLSAHSESITQKMGA